MMDPVFFEELKAVYSNIGTDTPTDDNVQQIICAYDKILYLCNLSKENGLLSLEDVAEELSTTPIELYLQHLIMLIVDGTDPEIVRETGMIRYVSQPFYGYDALVVLIYYKGMLLIQNGVNSRVLEEILKAMMPGYIREVLEKKEIQDRADQKESMEERMDRLVEKLCEYKADSEIDLNDNSLINQCALTLLNMSDHDIQQVLQNADNRDLELMMKGMPGIVRKRLFDNLSQTVRYLMADSINFMGPVRISDVKPACEKIAELIISLSESYEIMPEEKNIVALKMVSVDQRIRK